MPLAEPRPIAADSWVSVTLRATKAKSVVLATTSARQFKGRIRLAGINDPRRHRDCLWDSTELRMSSDGGGSWRVPKNDEGDDVDNIHLALELIP